MTRSHDWVDNTSNCHNTRKEHLTQKIKENDEGIGRKHTKDDRLWLTTTTNIGNCKLEAQRRLLQG